MNFDWRGFRFSLLTTLAALLLVFGAQGVTEHLGASFLAKNNLAGAAPTPSELAARVISFQKIMEVVPKTGKFIVADLSTMKLNLFLDGVSVAEYPILTKGRTGTPWETPSGLYSIEAKVGNHFSSIGDVYMPYSMQFYGNYFIHGWPYYPGGEPVAGTFSGGCIRLSTDDAKAIYEFADTGTGVFVYDTPPENTLKPLTIGEATPPQLTASAYLVADLDTGDVYKEHNAKTVLPIASVTKLMTALVANEMISLEKDIAVPEGEITRPKDPTDTTPKSFLIGDLLYPLLMESSNTVAESLANYYGRYHFVERMNETAKALGMTTTNYADASGISAGNTSTADDLYRLAVYLANKKSFVWGITRTPTKIIKSTDGESYNVENYNLFTGDPTFFGGKVGHTTAAEDTMVSVFKLNIGGEERRVAVIVLGSKHNGDDTSQLMAWFHRATSNALARSTDFRQIKTSN